MKATIGLNSKSANGVVSLNLDDIVEVKPMDTSVAFMREYNDILRIEALVPYDNIAYIICEPEEEAKE